MWLCKSFFSSEREAANFKVTCKLGTVPVNLIMLSLIRSERKGIWASGVERC